MVEKKYTYKYQDKQIRFSIWLSDDSARIDTVIFLGTFQINKLPQWVAENCPAGTAVVQGAPHWHARPDGSDVPEFMFGYTRSALESLATNYTLMELNVIAESQAVPSIIQLLVTGEYRNSVKSVVMLQPLGFTANKFTGTDEDRVQLFKQRIIKNGYHQLASLLVDSKLRYNHRLLAKMTSFRDPKVKAQYNSGLKHNALPDLRKLLSLNKEITIVCGAEDELFPAHEIEASLKREGLKIPVKEVSGVPHSPLATKQGNKLLQKAFSLLNP